MSGGGGGGSAGGGCFNCMCGADGTLACSPCGGGGSGGAGGGTDGGGASACMPGGACTPGDKCGGGSAGGGCFNCMCGADGTFACSPCGGGGTDGGSSSPPPSDGGAPASGPCNVVSMPSPGAGSPCRVAEMCPDGSSYRVTCDSTTSQCMCVAGGATTSAMPSLSCTGLDPIAALTACGFPAGKI
jgi:hypothetical protein